VAVRKDRAGIALVSFHGTPPFPPGDAFAGGVGVIPHFCFLLPHRPAPSGVCGAPLMATFRRKLTRCINLFSPASLDNKNRSQVWLIFTHCVPVFLAGSHPMNDHSRPFIVPVIADPARSFGVSHTSFAPAFLPGSGRMTIDHFIAADSVTGTPIKLYRFHYNLADDFPSI
jgi:hypothetical protein